MLDVTMYSGKTNSGDIMISPIEVSDLDQEIKISLPVVSDRALSCAFFDETQSVWEGLKCAKEEPS